MLTHRGARRARAYRAGLTLPELIVALFLAGIVGTAIVRVIWQQQRFYGGMSDIMQGRTSLRELTSVIPIDLRGVSPTGGDIYAMTDTSIDFRMPSGLSVVCQIGAARTAIVVPPATLSSRTGLTSWISTPQTGDTVLVYDEGATDGVIDDSWQPYVVVASPAAGSCPTTTRFTSTSSEASASITLLLNAALPASVVQGATIRFFRPAHYSLYQPSGGSWYLGFRDCPRAVCNALQPVSGPFMPAATSSSGVYFAYYDSTGATTTDPTKVARVDVKGRVETQAPVRLPGEAAQYVRDSLLVSVALRNR